MDEKAEPFEVLLRTGAILLNLVWLRKPLANEAIAVADSTVVERLHAEQTRLVPVLARTPQLEVVIRRVGEVQLALDVGDGGKVEVNGDRLLGPVRLRSEQDELAAGIHRNGDDRLDANSFAERVVLP